MQHEVVRTDPIKALEARKRRLERQPALMMPEIHFVGHIVGGINLVSDTSEGSIHSYWSPSLFYQHPDMGFYFVLFCK